MVLLLFLIQLTLPTVLLGTPREPCSLLPQLQRLPSSSVMIVNRAREEKEGRRFIDLVSFAPYFLGCTGGLRVNRVYSLFKINNLSRGALHVTSNFRAKKHVRVINVSDTL
jgi:hypothetical protein